jgi:hypothetical protein
MAEQAVRMMAEAAANMMAERVFITLYPQLCVIILYAQIIYSEYSICNILNCEIGGFQWGLWIITSNYQ